MPTNELETNTLYTEDCLEVMKTMREQQVDLIYLDPPFNSKADYNIIFGKNTNGKSSQLISFTDTWEWDLDSIKRVYSIKNDLYNPSKDVIEGLEIILGESGMLSYISYMAERLIECKRLLKDTGSVYLHCDPTASHYLKLLMDGIFGHKNFRNEIVWHRVKGAGKRTQHEPRTFGPATDTIFFYSKTPNYYFNIEGNLLPYSEKRLKNFKYKDKKGIYERRSPFNSPGQGARPNQCYEYKGFYPPHSSGWNVTLPTLKKMDQDGYLDFVGDRVYRKLYKGDGIHANSLWLDINQVAGKEDLGYPTQKPLDLVKRIIGIASKEGDLVLDPFCGCGTTVVAANELNRRWSGIDISYYAVNTVMRERLKNYNVTCSIKGSPTDLISAKSLAEKNAFHFEYWSVTLIPGAVPNEKQRWDKGIDGKALIHGGVDGFKSNELLFQVKGGKTISINDVRAFKSVVSREKAVGGVFIVLEDKLISKGMKQEFDQMGFFNKGATSYPRMQFWSIEKFFKGGTNRRPDIPSLAIPTNAKKKVPFTVWSD